MITNTKNAPTILIVDDNPENLDVLFQYFEHSEFRTLAAQDGHAALQQVEHTRPDLILLDIPMPGIDGFETCRRLKDNPSTQDIPVIFLTALSETEEKVEGFEAGGVDYITKPFQYEEVLARVKAHITIKRQQKQLQAQAAVLQDMNTQLKTINASKDKFFSIITHDLKSPFAGFLVIASLIKENIERWNKDKLIHFADQLQESVDTLYALIENLLTWSRFQQGMIEYHPNRVNIQYLVARNVALLIQNAQQKQITLRNSVQKPLLAYIDENMIDTVIRNLLSNAVKFTKPVGIVEIAATEDKRSVTLAVSDTGIGIHEDTLAGLFQIDAKTRQNGTEGEQGTGLGLLLCKEFVEKHNGTIWVESEIGRGSTFRFTVPRKSST